MTPLSDLIDAHVANNSPQSWIHFLTEFQRAQVGVVAAGDIEPRETGEIEVSANREIAVGRAEHPDAKGRSLALAFADPVEFAKRFGGRFNAAMTGEALLRTVFHNAECDGVLVHSATGELSVVIDRDTVERLVQPAPPGRPEQPWWGRR